MSSSESMMKMMEVKMSDREEGRGQNMPFHPSLCLLEIKLSDADLFLSAPSEDVFFNLDE